jgi:hypothetical protein
MSRTILYPHSWFDAGQSGQNYFFPSIYSVCAVSITKEKSITDYYFVAFNNMYKKYQLFLIYLKFQRILKKKILKSLFTKILRFQMKYQKKVFGSPLFDHCFSSKEKNSSVRWFIFNLHRTEYISIS